MKKLIIVLLSALSLTTHATTYYFAANGDDSNDGTSASSPWRTISKFNSASQNPGDNFLFNRGDIFYGSLIISRSGTSGSPITIGAYGSGAKPVITGFTTVSSWTNLGSNIWESSNAVSGLSTCNMVSVGGVNTAMGRTPNYPDYYTWQTLSGSSLTSSNLSGTNWTGAEVAVFTTTYTTARHPITGVSGSTLSYGTSGNPDINLQTPGSYFIPNFHIQNDPRTLDVQNEWYYNSSTKKLRIYSTSSPTNVQMATVDALVVTNNNSYITLDNLSFSGSNSDAVQLGGAPHFAAQYCDLNFIGRDAFYDGGGTTTIDHCTVNNANNFGIDLKGNSSNTVTNCTIKNIGMLIGMGAIPTPALLGNGINATGSNGVIAYNVVDTTALISIRFGGSNTIVNNNFVNHFCIGNGVKDGGGIYTNSGGTNLKVMNNIVLNAGALSKGIDCDDGSYGVEIGGNSVSNTLRGIYLHNSWNMNIHDNTTYANTQGELMLIGDDVDASMTNVTLLNNIFVAKTTATEVIWNNTIKTAAMPKPFTSDNNYFARPIDDNAPIVTYFLPNQTANNMSLSGWQSLNGQDAHSHKSPKAISDVNDLRFEYNATGSKQTISLPYNYIDVKNVSYNGSITLAPFTSAVLIKNGASTNKSPVANAGSNQTITLPTNSVTLSGSGTDPNGTITSYSWTKITGSGGAITSPGSASTTVTGLVQDIYQFQLQVTDNDGATDVDTVQVTVNGSGGTGGGSGGTGNLLPAVNPANTVNGLDYEYYEAGSYSVIPDFSALTPIKTGNNDNFDASLSDRATAFSLNFTGFINVPADGQYTFYTTSDDGSKLYIDNVPVVNNDGLHGAQEESGTIGLKAGKHSITVGYFQNNGDAVLDVNYAGPGVSKQAVPASALYRISDGSLLPAVNPSNTVNGLDYKYYEQLLSIFDLPIFSDLIPVKTGASTNFDISLSNRPKGFSFDFTGYIYVPSDGQYTFYITSDDGSDLYIDNVPVVNNDGLHGSTLKSGTIGLKAGKHAISVGYFQKDGDAVLNVSYAGPGIPQQLIPASALYRVSVSGLVMNPDTNQLIASPQAGVRAYPNPFTDYVEINITGGISGKYKLMLVDALGRTVWTKSGSKNDGAFQQSINTSALGKGTYFLKVIQGNTNSVIKLVK